MIIFKDKIEKAQKEDVKQKTKAMQKELYKLQQPLKDAGIPVMVVVEGFAASGKGEIIGEIISELDPRGYKVHVKPGIKAEDKRYPFMKASWERLPKKGDMAIFNHSWYYKAFINCEGKNVKKSIINRINNFERMLKDDGYLIIKIFLDIDKKEQKVRIEKLLQNESTAWRVSESDISFGQNFDTKSEIINRLMVKTSAQNIEWYKVDASESFSANYNVLKIITDKIKTAIKENEKSKVSKTQIEKEFDTIPMKKLGEIDPDIKISDEDYKRELKEQKVELKRLHGLLYKKQIPVILAFEGWDAAGKGGAIRRLSWALDPRGFEVIPIAAPTSEEINRHYLWRFYNHIPKDGHIAIFDRTWYGRVMVERIEGFTPEKRWKKAYDEINEFEASLTKWGAVVIKFFIHIDKDEQLKRFKDRQENPEKQYKITDEDWRNREKWDAYEGAIDEMIEKTSTKYAPWVIVEGNDKKYARIKILKTVREALEELIINNE